VKAQRERGIEVKIGIGRVRVKGNWRVWNEILKEKEEKEEIGKEKEEKEEIGKGKEEGSERNKEDIGVERKERMEIGMDKDGKIGEEREKGREENFRISREGRRGEEGWGEGDRDRDKGKRKLGDKIRKVLFWNVAGGGNKDKEFWKYIRSFDIINLCETWINEKGWESLKERLPVSHEWGCSFASRKGSRGRAKGGFLVGKKMEGDKRGSKLNIRKENEEMVWCNMYIGKESLDIIMVYGGKERGKLGDRKIEEFIGKEDLGSVIIGGDFNIRIGELGNGGIEESVAERYSKDKVIGNGGIQLAEWIMEKGWMILNGRTEGDWEGEYTYVGARGKFDNRLCYCK